MIIVKHSEVKAKDLLLVRSRKGIDRFGIYYIVNVEMKRGKKVLGSMMLAEITPNRLDAFAGPEFAESALTLKRGEKVRIGIIIGFEKDPSEISNARNPDGSPYEGIDGGEAKNPDAKSKPSAPKKGKKPGSTKGPSKEA